MTAKRRRVPVAFATRILEAERPSAGSGRAALQKSRKAADSQTARLCARRAKSKFRRGRQAATQQRQPTLREEREGWATRPGVDFIMVESGMRESGRAGRFGKGGPTEKSRRVAKGATLRYTGERQIPAAAGGLTRATANSRFLVVPVRHRDSLGMTTKGEAACRKIIRDAKRSSSSGCIRNRNPRGGPPFGRRRTGRALKAAEKPQIREGRDSALQKRTADSSSARQNSAGTRSE